LLGHRSRHYPAIPTRFLMPDKSDGSCKQAGVGLS
jgi:hypothetical protein